jgi:transcriptional regulator with XRE-family HTH domain
MSEKSEVEVVRLTNLLASAIRFSGWKQRDIEKSLGLSSGSMSRLLSGGIELKIKHVLEICEVIGFPPAFFFHASYPSTEGSSDSVRLQRLLEQLHPVPEATPEPPTTPQPEPVSSVNQAEIERIVFGALAKFFSTMGGGPPSG